MDLQYHIYGNITSQYSIYGNIIDLFDSPTIFPTISSLESVKKMLDCAAPTAPARALCFLRFLGDGGEGSFVPGSPAEPAKGEGGRK